MKVIRFEEGKKYYMTFPCDVSLVYFYDVTRRTENYVFLVDADGKTIKRKVQVQSENRCEVCRPLGKYAMSPVLKATDVYNMIVHSL